MDNFDYDHIEEGYYDWAINNKSGAQSKWHELKFNKIYKIIELEEGSVKLLDVACGAGTFISKLPSNVDCYGVDIAQKQIDYANKKYGNSRAKFIKCDDAKLPFDDNVFDVITSIEFIEHISVENCKLNFIEMKRCLKKNGKIILTTPNYRSIWPILEYIVSYITKENYLKQHITHYNREELKNLMMESGFVNVKVESYIFLSPFLVYLGNNLSNWLFKIEERYINRWGNLLIATGEVDSERL
jgi:ubiquinone/menaquinone biosynthesis C-methylase UbiE